MDENVEYENYVEFGDLKLANEMLFNSFTDSPVEFEGVKFLTFEDLPNENKLVNLGELQSTRLLGYLCNAIDHILIFVLTGIITVRCIQVGLEKTALHAYFCTLGFLCLLTEGMMMTYSGNIMALIYGKETKVIGHFVFLLIGGILGTYGAIHKFIFKPIHFKTRHGRYGLIAAILFLLNIFIGSITGVADVEGVLSPVFYNIFHKFLGITCLICAMISQFYAYDTGFFQRDVGHVKCFKICTALIMVLTLIGPFQNMIWDITEIIVQKTNIVVVKEAPI